VPYFDDEQEVYRYLGELFRTLVVDEELAPKFLAANTVVQFKCDKPSSQITLKLLEGEAGEVELGPTELAPEVVLTMDADVAHRFWLGKLSVGMAVMRGQIKTHGPVAKIMGLAPLVTPVVPRYRALLEAAGRPDLANV
jgi:putative sterol carrier protein